MNPFDIKSFSTTQKQWEWLSSIQLIDQSACRTLFDFIDKDPVLKRHPKYAELKDKLQSEAQPAERQPMENVHQVLSKYVEKWLSHLNYEIEQEKVGPIKSVKECLDLIKQANEKRKLPTEDQTDLTILNARQQTILEEHGLTSNKSMDELRDKLRRNSEPIPESIDEFYRNQATIYRITSIPRLEEFIEHTKKILEDTPNLVGMDVLRKVTTYYEHILKDDADKFSILIGGLYENALAYPDLEGKGRNTFSCYDGLKERLLRDVDLFISTRKGETDLAQNYLDNCESRYKIIDRDKVTEECLLSMYYMALNDEDLLIANAYNESGNTTLTPQQAIKETIKKGIQKQVGGNIALDSIGITDEWLEKTMSFWISNVSEPLDDFFLKSIRDILTSKLQLEKTSLESDIKELQNKLPNKIGNNIADLNTELDALKKNQANLRSATTKNMQKIQYNQTRIAEIHDLLDGVNKLSPEEEDRTRLEIEQNSQRLKKVASEIEVIRKKKRDELQKEYDESNKGFTKETDKLYLHYVKEWFLDPTTVLFIPDDRLLTELVPLGGEHPMSVKDCIIDVARSIYNDKHSIELAILSDCFDPKLTEQISTGKIEIGELAINKVEKDIRMAALDGRVDILESIYDSTVSPPHQFSDQVIEWSIVRASSLGHNTFAITLFKKNTIPLNIPRLLAKCIEFNADHVTKDKRLIELLSEKLLSDYILPDEQLSDFVYCIQQAIKHQDEELAKQLIDKFITSESNIHKILSSDIIDYIDSNTILRILQKTGNMDQAIKLRYSGRSHEEITLFDLAINEDNVKLFKLLLTANYDDVKRSIVVKRDTDIADDTTSSLEEAASSTNLEFIKLLLKKAIDNDDLEFATKLLTELKAADSLWEKSNLFEILKSDSYSIIYEAKKGENLEIFQFLIKERDTNTKETLLHIAVKDNNTKMIETLIQKNPALINCKDNKGNTPLDCECESQTKRTLMQCLQPLCSEHEKTPGTQLTTHKLLSEKPFTESDNVVAFMQKHQGDGIKPLNK